MPTPTKEEGIALTDHQPKPREPKPEPRPRPGWFWERAANVWRRRTTLIAVFAAAAILAHLVLRFGVRTGTGTTHIPLLAALVLGGLPLLYDLLRKVMKREFGSDLLGGISIITSVFLGEYLAGSIIVLMLSGR